MAFQIKDFRSIVASMVNWMRSTQTKITDFRVGAIGRTLVEAPAIEIDELYQQMLNGLNEAIPVSVYNSFEFEEIQSGPSSGLIRVIITAATTQTIIGSGTVFSSTANDQTFVANADTIIPAGSTFADILVTNEVAGTSGNIAAGTSFTASPEITGMVSASNQVAFANGVDEETPGERKTRFNAYISSLKRGTVAALEYGLSLSYLTDANGNVSERVMTSSIVEPWIDDNTQPISLVQCYIHNGVGGTSSDLVNQARKIIYGYYDGGGNAVPGWKAAGVKVDVFAATEQLMDIAGELDVVDGYDKPTLIASAEQAIAGHIQSLGIGKVLVKAELIRIVKSIAGVYDIRFPALADQTVTNKMTKLMPGTVALV